MNLPLAAITSSKSFPLIALESAHFFDHYEMADSSQLQGPLHAHKFERNMGENYVPGPTDIICARGKLAYNHSGNKWFRSLVAKRVEAYKQSKSKMEKSILVTAIMEIVHTAEPRGSFIRKHDGSWYEVVEAISREKVGQGFRDQILKVDRQSPKAFSSAPKNTNLRPRRASSNESIRSSGMDKVSSLSLQATEASAKSLAWQSKTSHEEDVVEPYPYEESIIAEHPIPPPLEFAETLQRRLSLAPNTREDSMEEVLDPSAFSPRPIYEGHRLADQTSSNNSAVFPPRQWSAPSALAAFGGNQNIPFLPPPNSLQNSTSGLRFSSSSSWNGGAIDPTSNLSLSFQGVSLPRRASMGRSSSYPGFSLQQKDRSIGIDMVAAPVNPVGSIEKPSSQVTSMAPGAATAERKDEAQKQGRDVEDMDIKTIASV